MSTVISGIGGYLPERILTNADIEAIVDTTDEWIVSRTGIKKRHIIAADQKTSDMAAMALSDALVNAQLGPGDLDGIIVATVTPDMIMPSTAVITQRKIGMKVSGFAFDIQAACSGFLYALDVAFHMMSSGNFRHIAVIGADSMSRILDWSDRKTCVLFGDGAGAFILSKSDSSNDINKGLICSRIYSDPSLIDILKAENIQCANGLDSKLLMDGPSVFKNAVDKLSSSMLEVISISGLRMDDIDIIVPHQANYRIIKSVLGNLGTFNDKVVSTISEHANTSAASIPLALNSRKETTLIKDKTLLFAAIGSGMTWGASIVRT